MRAFVIVGHRASLKPDFMLNDLPGSAGRLDILCRCITAAFCLSHGIRRDVNTYLILQNQVAIRLEGTHLRHLNPDERSTATLLQKALKAYGERPDMDEEIESTPGIYVASGTLSDALGAVRNMGLTTYLLHEQGDLIRQSELAADAAFVLSDHLNFERQEELLLSDLPRVSLGPLALHADHCIAITHNELDVRSHLPAPGPVATQAFLV